MSLIRTARLRQRTQLVGLCAALGACGVAERRVTETGRDTASGGAPVTAGAGAGGRSQASTAGKSGANTGGAKAGGTSTGGLGAGGAGAGGRDGGAGGTSNARAGTAGKSNAGATDAETGGAAAGEGGAETSGPTIATVYTPCTTSGELACEGNAQEGRLACDGKQWVPNGQCSAQSNCDTRTGPTTGLCVPIVEQCAGLMPEVPTCEDMTVVTCGADLTTVSTQSCAAGTQTCVDDACVNCATGKANCDDDAADCETNLNDPASCGTTCGDKLKCSSTNGTASCASGVCGIRCNVGYGDCKGTNDGCETDLTAVATCGESCADAAACDLLSAATCVNGGCRADWVAWPVPNSPNADPEAPNPESYTNNGDGSVTDRVTGLVWQQTPPTGTYTQSAAVDYCTGLTLAGHHDWRLPAYIELISIVDYGTYDPAINTTYFLGTQSGTNPVAYYWSSTLMAGETGDVWVVSFYSGGGNAVTGVDDVQYVRCVR